MRFSVATKTLYTSDGRKLKQLSCPLRKQWGDLELTADARARLCGGCGHPVLDTALYKEDELAQVLDDNPHTCLKVSARQANITLE